MNERRRVGPAVAAMLAVFCAVPGWAQTSSQRGFVDARVVGYPQDGTIDSQQVVVDLRVRDEVFLRPAPWIQLAAGVDVRANSHEQLGDSWKPDFSDRGILRPRLSVRRLGATLTRGSLVVDLGRQFIRWGKTDITAPTDRFAPRDFLNVVDAEFLSVAGARVVYQGKTDSIDLVWVPFFTPSRMPLLDQRWTVIPAAATGVALVDGGGSIPKGSQVGVRWSHTATAIEYSLSYYDGYNNVPDVDALPPVFRPAPTVPIVRQYPRLRTYGGDAALPTRWVTFKAEAEYFTSPDSASDEFVLYVVQAERQTGDWLLIGGYAGEADVRRRTLMNSSPDRDVARSIIGRASYTLDSNRSVAFEGAVRQNGDGVYVKGEYSQGRGQHWRATVGGALIRGNPGDFLGQYRRNSHVTASLRYSF